jgi:hypothetical protein
VRAGLVAEVAADVRRRTGHEPEESASSRRWLRPSDANLPLGVILPSSNG